VLLSLAFALVTGLSLLILGLVSLSGARANLEDLNRDRSLLVIDAIENTLREHLEPVERQLEAAATWFAAEPARMQREDEIGVYFRGALAATPQVPALALVFPDYRTLYVPRAGGPLSVQDWSARPEIAAAVWTQRVRPQPNWSEPFYSPIAGTTILVHRRPVIVDGQVRAVLLSSVPIIDLSRHLAQMQEGLRVIAFVLHGRDRVLAHPALTDPAFFTPTAAVPLPSLRDGFPREMAAIWTERQRPLSAVAPSDRFSGHYINLDGSFRVYVYRETTRYGPTGWLIGMHFGSELAGEVNRFWWSVGISVAVLAASVLAAVLIGRRLARPVVRLADAAARVRHGALAEVPELPATGVRELDRAAGAFNAMLTGLRWSETYLPKALIRRLLDRGEDVTGPRQQTLTILFADIAGFSRLAESMTAAQVATLLNEHFAMLGACVEATDGTIDKYIGDCLMAFWGAPDQQPDHAERAWRAVRMIARSLEGRNVARRESGRPVIRLRIGLHTGRAIVGNIGFEGRINYTTVGDTVNIAQRLEQLGRDLGDGEEAIALASEAFVAAAGLDHEAEPLGARDLRGRTAPVAVFRLRP
jgi:class 3 adenylate cyclase